MLLSLLVLASADPHISDCGPQPSKECVHRALKLDGAVAIGVPGLAAARKAAFVAIAACLDRPQAHRSVVTLPDGTSRATFGTRTIGGLPEPLEGCPEAEGDVAAVRALVDVASRRFLELVQPLMRSDAGLLRIDNGEDPRYTNLAEIARAGEQLEHFHLYEPAVDSNASAVTSAGSEPAVPLHTDAGLFIAIVPAMHVVAPNAQGGRFVPHSPPSADVAAGRPSATASMFKVGTARTRGCMHHRTRRRWSSCSVTDGPRGSTRSYSPRSAPHLTQW